MVAIPGLQISDETKQQFADFIALITESESMNVQEKQYWINILPVMTPEQLESLREILVNEKKQLAAIDAKYAKQIDEIGKRQAAQELEKQRTAQRSSLLTSESQANSAELALEQDILQQIESL